jgi:hypothetical protein
MRQLGRGLFSLFFALGNSAVCGCMSLLVLQIKVLWGTWQSWDLPLWDGATYFIYGQQVANTFSFPPLAWSPGFSAYYAIFHILFADADPFTIYYAHRLTTIVIVLVLSYFLLRANLSPGVSWLLMVYSTVLSISLNNHYVVLSFAVIPLLGAYLASLSKSVYGNSLVLVCLLLAAFVRSEFFVSFTTALIVLVVSDYALCRRQRLEIKKWVWRYVPLLVAATALALLIIRAGPSHTPINRLWGAFMQHYALGYQERHPEWTANPWFQYDEPIGLSFGYADTIVEAVLHNPVAVLTHILWNLGLFPRALLDLLTPAFPLSWMGALIGLGVIGLFVAVFADRRQLWHSCSQVFRFEIVRRHKLWFILLCGSVPSIASALFIRPRSIYLIPVLPQIFLMVGCGLEWLRSRFIPVEQFELILPLAFVILLTVFPTPFNSPADRLAIATAESLKGIPIEGAYGLLGASARGFCIYSAPDDCQGMEIVQVPNDGLPFPLFLMQHNIRVVLLDDRLVNNLPSAGQVFMTELQAHPEEVGWQLFDTVGKYSIYVLADDY